METVAISRLAVPIGQALSSSQGTKSVHIPPQPTGKAPNIPSHATPSNNICLHLTSEDCLQVTRTMNSDLYLEWINIDGNAPNSPPSRSRLEQDVLTCRVLTRLAKTIACPRATGTDHQDKYINIYSTRPVPAEHATVIAKTSQLQQHGEKCRMSEPRPELRHCRRSS